MTLNLFVLHYEDVLKLSKAMERRSIEKYTDDEHCTLSTFYRDVKFPFLPIVEIDLIFATLKSRRQFNIFRFL